MSQASSSHGPNGGMSRRKRYIWIGGIVVVLLLIIIIPIAVVVPKKNAEAAEKDEMLAMISSTLEREGVDSSGLGNSNHHQGKAFNWIFESSDGMERSQILQRYALAAFYYATNGVETKYTPVNPPAWVSSVNWLSDQHECEWQGVQCSSRMKVNGISMEKNQLTGAIPGDLVLLRDHLETLDFTSNLLYMLAPQFSVLEKMEKLETILMNDNYISTTDGIPSSIGSCSALTKLRLSYNLIGGSLDAQMFRGLSKLTHLEVESNFLTGNIPNAIGNLENLVYLYMRRNSMKFNLNFVKTGKLKNLFALWLDANTITGTLPTQLGELTELASLSITNGTLTGTIPTELGSITSLRRLWLYGNNLFGTIPTELTKLTDLEVLELQRNRLTGIMPQQICSTVNGKVYDHKSLTVDCKNVTCASPGCCTHC
eukprot:CAMPEP_0119003380 /NCGR_PEP_ID=MMETSP1176-20130426/527_1 /TAXON_ID=265551 /ORGANISM="Synedropsis recta cf, Strain CCMP1620" /LENGTH=426 /DNA_ID=CAMNT_0006954979 /DNA_START=169 /DNA_END=1449 /DNA_ORIENTATION=+